MPMIHIQTNKTIPGYMETKLTKALGEAIEVFPGKSQEVLMIRFEGDCHLYFQGNGLRSTAFIAVKLYGHGEKEHYEHFTQAVTRLMEEELQISKDCLFIAYDELPHWGWKGTVS